MDSSPQAINYQDDFIQYIYESEIVPIVSNSFRLEAIFHTDETLLNEIKATEPPRFYDQVLTIDQQLTRKWAQEVVHYPMSDGHNLARVAQYLQVVKSSSDFAKRDYLKFLNDHLLRLNQNRKGYEAAVSQFQKPGPRLSFSKVVKELDLPIYPEGKDPIRLLAKLPLPIYITTSYFHFIEEALKQEPPKTPSTQYWSWSSGETTIKLEGSPDPGNPTPVSPREYHPEPMKPVVYHLFGIEDLPRSLVLSEDDYMNFLMNSSEGLNSYEVFPEPLREALSQKRLLLLGYDLRDWDFRALFRLITKFRNRALNPSIAIQLMPNLQNKEFEKQALHYLEKYFEDYEFDIIWIDTEQFIYELLECWNGVS